MPGENVYGWSTTAADNATSDSLINWQEGQARATVNNSSRSELAAHAKFRNLITGSITTGGTAEAMTFVSGVSFTEVPTPMRVLLKIGATNGAGTTLNMDGIGAVAIKDQRGQNLVGGEMVLNSFAELIYDGSAWVLITSSAAAVHTTQVFTSGTGTYTTPAGVKWIEVEMVGGGGGGAGGGAGGGVGTNGGASAFATFVAGPGEPGAGSPGAGSGGYLNLRGTRGAGGSPSVAGLLNGVGGIGGSSYFGGGGGTQRGAEGLPAEDNTGSGGGGGAARTTSSQDSGFGGSSGGYVRGIIVAPATTYTYAVGPGGNNGNSGIDGDHGGTGAAGIIIVHEHY